jgi:hypothetical protein
MGVVTYFMLFDPFTFDNGTAFRHLSASLPAMVVAMASYFLLAKIFIIPAGQGGYAKGPTTNRI